jgi:2-polyprenyl-3-methyl-5-hydroxy-6-metoxy-1,4-benzoquinol methylase
MKWAGERLKKGSKTQKRFIEWNAERLNIDFNESRDRYIKSMASLFNGHGGAKFNEFSSVSHEVFLPFFSDNKEEIYDTYSFYGYLYFLRMLSYNDPVWQADHPVILGTAELNPVTILDFGCGLAQHSRSLAEYMKESGKDVRLYFADIPTIRKDFLLWLAEKDGIKADFLDCTKETPLPEFAPSDVCIATEVFEHLYDPIPYFHKIDEALNVGGYLITNASDHHAGFMHASPKLGLLRKEFSSLGYEEVYKHRLYKKTR